MLFLHVHPDNPQPRNITTIVDVLRKGGVIIYPTDTIYGLGCSIYEHKAIEKICWLKQIVPAKANLSMICYDLSNLSDFAKQISTPTYRMLKDHLPGPYTFILPASKQVPKILQTKKDTIGIRIPNNNITRAIVKELGHPILSASLPGEMVEDYTDPDVMVENFRNDVDIVVHGGIGSMIASTIIDCTGDLPEMIRQGAGIWE